VEKFVKQGFGGRFLASRKGDFQTQDRKGTQPIGGGFSLLKVTIAPVTKPTQSPLFFQEMVCISKLFKFLDFQGK
jgi:hypothetical protein